ncbi:MAG: GA module-containing protein, partial [Corynebacterium sp.]|nr:GA module-containing protein [Corynebacterium sp.]
MNNKGRISRSFGRMAVASTLALSTAAGVVVAPQMAAVAHAEAVTKSHYEKAANGFAESTLYVTKNDDGTYDFKLVYKNLKSLTMINPELKISGIEYDASKATILIGDGRYSQYTPVYNPYNNLQDSRYPFKLSDGDGSAIINNVVATSGGANSSGAAGSRMIVGANAGNVALGKNDQSSKIDEVEVNIKGATLKSGETPVLAFSALPGTPFPSNSWAENKDDIGSALWSAMNNVETTASNPWKNIWNLINAKYQPSNTGAAREALAGVANGYLLNVMKEVQNLPTDQRRTSSPVSDSNGNSVLQGLIDEVNGTDEATQEDKTAAAAKLGALTNLEDKQRESYVAAVNAATKKSDIDAIVAAATNIDKVMGAESDGKGETATIQEDKDAAKAAVIDILATDTTGTTPKDGVRQQKLDDLKAEAEKAATALDVAKVIAKAKIEALENLTPDEKDAYQKQIDEAKDPKTVKEILDKAEAADKAKADDKATDSDKDSAVAQLGELKNLTDAQRKSYEDQVKAATSKDAINDIVQGAKNVNGDKDDATAKPNDLAKDSDKTAGDAAIDALGLPSETADKFKKEYAGDDAKAIDVAKAVAKAQIEALPNLTREEKDAYQKQIDDATNGTDIKNIVDAATAADKAKADDKATDSDKDSA